MGIKKGFEKRILAPLIWETNFKQRSATKYECACCGYTSQMKDYPVIGAPTFCPNCGSGHDTYIFGRVENAEPRIKYHDILEFEGFKPEPEVEALEV